MQTPDQIGLQFADVKLQDSGEPDLLGWWLHSKVSPAKGTVVFLHGNAENISTHINSVYWLPDYGFNVLMAEYRGYGGSDGEPSVEGLHEDARRFLRYAKQNNIEGLPLILYGQSLGASIALVVASESEVPLSLVIAEAGFSSYRAAAFDSMNGLGFARYFFAPFTGFVSNTYSPRDFVAKIKTPVLFVHGTADQVIPVRHSTRLHAQLAGSTFWEIEEGKHLGLFIDSKSRKRLASFIEDFLSSSRSSQ